jgi:hypothetical protein
LSRATSSIAFLAALASAAAAQDGGRLIAVRAGGDALSSSVELIGDRPLSFTTLQLDSPPRVVVDFADTAVAFAPAELAVGDGTIRRVAAAQEAGLTARVVIELAGQAEFDVRAKGSIVEVRVPRIAPRIARKTPPPAPSQSEAEKRASLPTVSLAGSRPSEAAAPRQPDAATEKQRRLEAAEERRRAAEEKKRIAADAAEEKKRAAAHAAEEKKRAAAQAAVENKRAAAQAAEEKKRKADQAAEEKKRALAAAAQAAQEKKRAAAHAAEEKKRKAAEAVEERKVAAARAAEEKKHVAAQAAAEKKHVAAQAAAEKKHVAEQAAGEKKRKAAQAAEDQRRAAEAARREKAARLAKAETQRKAADAARRAAAERTEADRREAASRAKAARQAAQAEAARKAEDEKLERKKAAEARAGAVRAERDRATAEKAAADKARRERAAAEKEAADKARRERLAQKAAAEKARRERLAQKAAAEKARRAPPPLLTVEEAKALRAAAEAGQPITLGTAPAPRDDGGTKSSLEKQPDAGEKSRTTRVARAGSASGARLEIASIGFRPVGGGEVVIRSDAPLRYGIAGDDRTVVLHLPGAAISRANDRRPLDTRFFDGPVARIVPVEVSGGTDLRIELRAPAQYQLSQDGSVLTVVFSAAR